MSKEDSSRVARWVSYIAGATLVLGGVFMAGVSVAWFNLPPFPQIRDAKAVIEETLRGGFTEEELIRLHTQPARGQGAGVTVNRRPDDGALIKLVGFFDGGPQVRLVDRSGTPVRTWDFDYFEHFPDRETRPCDIATPLRTDLHGVVMTPRGEVVANYEYCGAVKLDRCGNVLWTVDKPTHHSMKEAADGGYWTLGRWFWESNRDPGRMPPFSRPGPMTLMLDDTILRLGEDGAVLDERSIAGLIMDSGLGYVLTADGEIYAGYTRTRDEIVHANQVTELPADIADAFPLFEAGDLVVSMRELNLVIVIDPDDWRVKWHQTGPWLRQHDPEFRPDGLISVFNNNVFRTSYRGGPFRGGQTRLDAPRITNIVTVDPVTRAVEVVFGDREGEEMLSVIRGQHELLRDGGMIIAEFDAGRALEVSAEREIVWSYVNAYDETRVGELVGANVFRPDYFEVDMRASCASG